MSRNTEFAPSDVGTDGLTDVERKEYFAHLNVKLVYSVMFKVQSKEDPKKYYNVLHDFTEPVQCYCTAGSFSKCKAHYQRVRLVLKRQQDRLKAQAEQRRRDEAALNGNREFSLLKQPA